MARTERLMRRTRQQGGLLLGLCAGIGDHLGLDPVLVRFALLCVVCLSAGGLGVLLLYFVFALLVPVSTAEA